MPSLTLLLFCGLAHAEGYSTDIELVRPTFSPGAVAGFDTPNFGRPGTVRVGTLLQYERDPLILYQLEREAGAVVSNRLMAHLGVSVDLTKRLSARFVLPIGGQWGTEVERLAADQGGIGDASLGARFKLFELGPLVTAARADIYLPFGTQGAYLGENGLRGMGGLVAEAKLGPVAFLADAGVLGRAVVATDQDFELGSELALQGGVRLDIWPDNVALGAGVITRTGFTKFWTGEAETPAELVAGIQLRPANDWRLDVGFGRGLAPGYGTTQFRVYTGLTWQRSPPLPPSMTPEPLSKVLITEAPDIPVDPIELILEPEKPAWKEDELARVEESQIVIRDPIQFELATNRILPESIPTLHAISKLLAEHPEIGHLVIEGHASEEGSFAYNYDLSIRRSLAIFQELVLAGTYPARLSCRGMGEVEPVALGSTETQLATNRRVIFHIVRRLKAGEEPPAMRTEMLLPWNGDPKTFKALPPIPAPEPVATPPKAVPKNPDDDYPTDPNLFREREDDDEEEDAPK
ncbi:MAG: OmpA family protein [Pseudomonadota bacterium]|nr:OmpA family protein [Pseudomonadota bacterium]